MRSNQGCMRGLFGLFLSSHFIAAALAVPILASEDPPAKPDEANQVEGEPQPAKTRLASRITRFISPDGKQVAYPLAIVGPMGDSTSHILVSNVDGTNRRTLDVPFDRTIDVLWFGNDRLAYTPEDSPAEYRVISLEGKRLETIKLPDICDIRFDDKAPSPDGRWITYSGGLKSAPKEKRGEEGGLMIVDVATQKVRRLLPHHLRTLPAWSPDSKKIAVAAVGGYVKDYPLVVVDVETGNVDKLGCNGVGASWSPDGRYLAYTTEILKGGSWLAGIPLDGRIGVWDLETKQLTHVSPAGVNNQEKKLSRWEIAGSLRPVWSPDSRTIAYQRRHTITGQGIDEQSTETWLVERDGTGARKVLNHSARVEWTPDGQTLIWTEEGQSGRIARDVRADLGPTPRKPTGEFSVFGTVTDDQGKPLPDVAVTVATGWGTLRLSEPVKTAQDGTYRIHFGPGMMFGAGDQLQCAIVHARKPGYYDRELGQTGNLGMAYRKPTGMYIQTFRAIVYPGNPYKLDLVMQRAARVHAKLIAADGKVLAKYRVGLDGKSFPATGVVATQETDGEGRFSFDTIPLKPYRFVLSSARAGIKSDPFPFEKSGDYQIVLTYRPLEATLQWVTESSPR